MDCTFVLRSNRQYLFGNDCGVSEGKLSELFSAALCCLERLVSKVACLVLSGR